MSTRRGEGERSGGGYSGIEEYGLISDRHTAALVSREGSIDWCCAPRIDSAALFSGLLDSERGGCCAFDLDAAPSGRAYLGQSFVLESRFEGPGGEARLLDFFSRPRDGGWPTVVRILEGVRGSVDFAVRLEPRFDYGAVDPWLRDAGEGVFAAIGGDDGLLIRSDAELEAVDRHRLRAEGTVREKERTRLVLGFHRPVELEDLDRFGPLDPGAVDESLDEAVDWWHEWSRDIEGDLGDDLRGAARSALVLKALSYEPTGAIAAAATTSLPEVRALSGERNWDYRYSWVRDSALAVRSLAELGCEQDADDFRRFMERSAAGNAGDLQVLFGVGGERRLAEQELGHLDGWMGSRPVRAGNQASGQLQLDAFGQLVDQSWRWHLRGNSPDPDYWRFVADLVETAIANWEEPDKGIWEWRGEPRHFVHSKALTWAAVDRGMRVAEDTGREVPGHWPEAREQIREAVESRGFDGSRGTFLMAFGHPEVDAALLRLPTVGFLEWDDERMVGTADAIREQLDLGGLVRRYGADDGMPEEGAFLACTFWLASCLAEQGRAGEAREVFDRAAGTANDLGLFSEEYDPDAGRMLGNFPQGLTHLAHIEAALALAEAER